MQIHHPQTYHLVGGPLDGEQWHGDVLGWNDGTAVVVTLDPGDTKRYLAYRSEPGALIDAEVELEFVGWRDRP